VNSGDGTGFPAWTGATWDRVAPLRYGENPHQPAALYRHWRPGIAHAVQLHGKEMSYNNYVDADAAMRAAHDHGDQPTVAIVKHANPCGIAVGTTLVEAYDKAHACDPQSAYGGIIATNQTVTAELVEHTKGVFTEVIVASAFDEDALALLRERKNVRVLRLPADMERFRDPIEVRPISGGILVQTPDRVDAVVRSPEGGEPTGGDDPAYWRLVAGEPADADTLADLAFAWRSIRAVKSNAILLARDGASVGVGMGQVNRVDSCRLAVARAGVERAAGSVAASDAFFPFPDGMEILLDAGVRAVVAPGGSIRDDVIIDTAQRAGVTMYFTGTRHFAH
jgi:phosphoribosylaminoimidazolecarboxamide formyltransferase/IMP cyclohydrolase